MQAQKDYSDLGQTRKGRGWRSDTRGQRSAVYGSATRPLFIFNGYGTRKDLVSVGWQLN